MDGRVVCALDVILWTRLCRASGTDSHLEIRNVHEQISGLAEHATASQNICEEGDEREWTQIQLRAFAVTDANEDVYLLNSFQKLQRVGVLLCDTERP
jgi:hypothetical protein